MIQILHAMSTLQIHRGFRSVHVEPQYAMPIHLAQQQLYSALSKNQSFRSALEAAKNVGFQRNRTVARILWKSFVLIALLSLLTACTRNRPTPEAITLPTPSLAADGSVSNVQQPVIEEVGEQQASAESAVEPAQSVAPTVAQPTPPPVVPAVTPVPSSGEDRIILYTVKSGDTVGSIATNYGITPQQLRELNLLENNYLQAGQLLRVPLLDGYTEFGLPTATPEPYIHVVQSGETLFGIALQYGIEATALIAANNIVDQNGLFIGQRLAIPGYAAGSSPNAAGSSQPAAASANQSTSSNTADSSSGAGFQVVHVVKPGEGLYAIAGQYNVSADAIASANNIQNYELLRVGQRLFIPGVTLNVAPSSPEQQVHVVQAGEGLLQIAITYGVSAQAISELNKLADSDLIYPGQQLVIPGQ